jgi:GDPmannose 4,6-dehydratase
MSHVGTSFDIPNYATLVDGASVVSLVDLVKVLAPSCVFYQASTSELFGGSLGQAPQDITTSFDPRSPYAVAKLMAHNTVLNARRAGELLTVCGILFNHESPRRGKTFVTKKITRYVAEFTNNMTTAPLQLGNLGAVRDWGYAPDYVQVIFDSVLDPKDDVYCCGTTIGTTVRDFARLAFAAANSDIAFEGSGLDEVGYEVGSGRVVLQVSPKYFRPLEVDNLIAGQLGNRLLDYSFFTIDRIVDAMVSYDLQNHEYGGLEYDHQYSRFWQQ